MTPRDIANQQLVAYNNHDLNEFCSLFDKHATLTDLPSSTILAQGIEEIRALYKVRFAETKLHCKVHTTSDIGNFATDRETLYGLTNEPVDIIAMYEVINDKIHRVFFIRDQSS